MPTKIKKNFKTLGIRIYDQDIIQLINNLHDYYIRDYQLGFKSQSQLAEVCLKYLLEKNTKPIHRQRRR